MLSKYSTQWAEDFLQQHDGEPTQEGVNLADGILVSQLRRHDFFVPEVTLSAIELSKGGMPLDQQSVAGTLNNVALQTLDGLVEKGGVIESGSFSGFDLDQVAEAQKLSIDSRVIDYCNRIRTADDLKGVVRKICGDDELAGSVLRLLAVRTSKRIQFVQSELDFHLGQDREFDSLKQIDSKIGSVCDDYCNHVSSFLAQLDRRAKLPPVIDAPILHGKERVATNSDDGSSWSFLGGVAVAFIIAGMFVLKLLSPTDTASRPKYPGPKQVDPIAMMQKMERLSVVAATQAYVNERETWPKLFDAMQIVKKGIFEQDDELFVEATEHLKSAYVTDEKLESYAALREDAVAMRSAPNAGEMAEKRLRSDYAKWWAELPNIEAIDNDSEAGLSAEESLLRLELELVKKRNAEMEPTRKILQLLKDAKSSTNKGK